MSKAQAYLIITVFFVVFILLLKHTYFSFQHSSFIVDKMKMKNIASEIENFIPRFYTNKSKELLLKSFIKFIRKNEPFINFFIAYFEKNVSGIKTFLYVNGEYKIPYSIRIENKSFEGTVTTEKSFSTLSSEDISFIQFQFLINNVKHENTFYLSKNSTALFYYIDKELENKNLVVFSNFKIY